MGRGGEDNEDDDDDCDCDSDDDIGSFFPLSEPPLPPPPLFLWNKMSSTQYSVKVGKSLLSTFLSP